MLFNSFEFVLFFPIVVIIFYVIPGQFRWFWLLIASYVFYASWKPAYIVLILISTTIDYVVGRGLGRGYSRTVNSLLLLASLVTNLGILFFFKYFGFFRSTVETLTMALAIPINLPNFDVALPVGISFYTFQTLSYTIDVYQGRKQPETNLGKFALYVAFFPQLVAGPIERSTRLLPQLFRSIHFNWKRITDGLKIMLWGFFKKVVIADRTAMFVDKVYESPDFYSGFLLTVGTYLYAFQIYCDFSGYSDIAIGAAKVLDIDLMENFRRPYFSKSIPEFWRRWHISLSTWFRDYLYIPLGGNRTTTYRWYFNIFLVFVISGLWHGSAWTFVIWGALHGMFYWADDLLRRFEVLDSVGNAFPEPITDYFSNYSKWIRVFITFNLVSFGWIFFRSPTVTHALEIITIIIQDLHKLPFQILAAPVYFAEFEIFDLSPFDFLLIFGSIGVLLAIHLQERHTDRRFVLVERPTWINWTIYYMLILSVCFLGQYSERPFIYFQF